MTKVFSFLLVVELLIALVASSAHAVEYTKRYLEMLPGCPQSVAMAVNESGLAAGLVRDADNKRKPVYWDVAGHVHALALSNDKSEGIVFAVNSQGWMLGRQYTSFDYYGQLTLWKPDGSFQMLPYGDGGALNDAGLVGGAQGNQAIIYRPDGTSQILPNIVPTADVMSGRVTGLTDSGQAVGICSYQIGKTKVTSAVRWDSSGDLSLIDGLYVDGYATLAVNDRGDVLDNRGKLAFADGSSRQLQLPAGYTWGGTRSINNMGLVAGSTYQGTALLWDEDGVVSIIDVPVSGSNYYLNYINDNGVIAGSVYTRYQGDAAVLWMPVVPEPGSLSVIILGLAGFAGVIRRNRRLRA